MEIIQLKNKIIFKKKTELISPIAQGINKKFVKKLLRTNR